MAENHLPPVSVVQGRPLLLLGIILVAVEQYPFPKKTVVSHVCCFCHVNQFDKSFGTDGFWSCHVLYKRQLFGQCGSSLLHHEFAWQDRHQTKVLMMVIRCLEFLL